MMDTVLNLGLNATTLRRSRGAHQGSSAFALDAYRRFIQLFGKIVLGIDGELFEDALDAIKKRKKVKTDADLSASALRGVGRRVQGDRQAPFAHRVPRGSRWTSSALRSARCSSPGTTSARPTIATSTASPTTSAPRSTCSPWCSATWATTPGPASRSRAIPHRREAAVRRVPAQRAGRGRRRGHPDAQADRGDGDGYSQGIQAVRTDRRTLEKHYHDVQDLEFTIERGKLYMLQTRSGKRTARSGGEDRRRHGPRTLITKREAVMRVEPAQVDQLLLPRIDPQGEGQRPRHRAGRVPGRRLRQGRFRRRPGRGVAKQGEKVILVRIETNPDDVHGMIAAEGVLTSRGGAHLTRGGGRPRHGQALRRGRGVRSGRPGSVSSPRAARRSRRASFTIDGTTGT